MAKTAHEGERYAGDINAWFFEETSLEDLLAHHGPLTSFEDLAIEDLTPEEAEAFLHAVEE